MDRSDITPRFASWSISTLLVAIAYAVTAKVSFLFTIPPGNITPVFPAAGLALAAVIIMGRNALIGVWLGSFAANFLSFIDGSMPSVHMGVPNVLVSAFIGIGAVSGAAAGSYLVRRLCGNESPLQSGRNVLILVAVGALGCCAISPSVGVLSLSLGGNIPWDQFNYSWVTWWVGDAAGTLVAAPFFLAWRRPQPFHKTAGRIIEMIVLGSVTLLACFFVFFRNIPFEYGLLALLLWAALRFGMRGASTTAVVIALLATVGASYGSSPFAGKTTNESLLLLNSFLGVTITCALFLAGMMEEQRRTDEKLGALNRALRQSEQKYRELVELANSIILRWTSEGKITFLNDFGLRFFGYAADEILGRHVMDTIAPPTGSDGSDLRQFMEQICTSPKVFEQNVNENMRKNGNRVWIAWTNKVVLDESGNVAEILSVGTDITERKRAEEQIRQLHEDLQRYATELERRVEERTGELAVARDRAEAADRLKSAFLATMSHELRTPLNSIIGFTGIILQGLAGPLNPEQTKQLEMVRTSARHLLALINDVLDISKIEAGQLEVACEAFDLRASIEKTAATVKPLAAKKSLSLQVELAPEIGVWVSDVRRIEQILINLLNNAIKFTERGYVMLTAKIVRNVLQISVADTGIGIHTDDFQKIFQPFRQIDTGLARSHEGTGLGLAIWRLVT